MMENNQEKKVIELKPLSKWKRILLALGDYFIAFILSFVLFNLAIFPLAKVICQTQKRNQEAEQLQLTANDLLIKSGLLFEEKVLVNSFENDVNYTFKVFLSYYAFDEESPVKDQPQYGHKLENEVIRTYYLKFLNDEQKYISDFKAVDVDHMFNFGDTANDMSLKDDYKKLLSAELVEVTDEDNYSETMTNFRDHIFAQLFYVHVYNDIVEKDLVVDGVSFNDCMNRIKQIGKSLQWVVVVSSLISITLSWGVVYVLYPLINKERRTITMSAMHLTKLNYKTLSFITRGNVWIQSFYYFVLSMSSCLILPVLYFGIGYCFNLPILLILSAISLLLSIVSLFFILFNEYNRSGSDILTNNVVLLSSEIDVLYRENVING